MVNASVLSPKREYAIHNVLSRGTDALAPRTHDRRTDHFANVELAREGRAERMTLFFVHPVRKQPLSLLRR